MGEDRREDLLDALHRLAEELGETPTTTEMNDQGEYWASQYQNEFGGWNEALREAGFEPNQVWKVPTDDLLNEIRQLARELNRTPTKEQMDDRGEYYGRSYLKRFGSWNEAVHQAGFEPNQRIPQSAFREPPDACRLCGDAPDVGLDFHHWRYGENKAGCYLCRACHDDVHAAGARPDNDPGWLMGAVENLIRCHAKHSEETSVRAITTRYNIPSEGLVASAMSNVEV
ncbi:homing endonuclease associated repeat-containing protein [Haloferax sulfurifontis]|uniref:homing endonuclease associated repeat-containing protein n=1 Tax=Haloferax sulfurifontis TaxID=255616 RepID=UPI0026A12194